MVNKVYMMWILAYGVVYIKYFPEDLSRYYADSYY